MKISRYGIALGLLAGLGACSNMMGGGTGSQTTATAQPTVAPDMVRQVQSKLRDDGYYKQGPVDGVWGSATQAAVRSFQHDHNLTANGQLDVPTLHALNLANDSTSSTANNNPAPTQPNYSSTPSAATANNNPAPAQSNYAPNPPANTTNSNSAPAQPNYAPNPPANSATNPPR